MLAKRPYGWKPVLKLPAVYVGLTRNRATRGERSQGMDLSARGPSDDDLRMWPQSMAPHDIEHLTSFRACEMLRAQLPEDIVEAVFQEWRELKTQT